MKRALLGLFLLLPFLTLLAPGSPALDDRQGSPDRERFVTGEMAECRLCHRARYDAFTAGSHGTGEIGCLDCHEGADEHALSSGRTAAPDPRTYSLPRALALCTGCHDPEDDAFTVQHGGETYAGRSCLECHSFHEVTNALTEPPAPRRSHGREVSDAPSHRLAGMPVTRATVEVGARGIDGDEGAFRTHANLEPGARLARAVLQAEAEEGADGVDHFYLDVAGLGDPASYARFEVGDFGAWSLRVHADRHEWLFDPATDLSDSFTVRASLGADLEWRTAHGTGMVVGYERLERREDALRGRFREVSNERFESVEGDQVETADLLRFRADGRIDDWRWQSKSTLRHWQVTDARDFLSPNSLLDDMEDFDSHSRALTASTSLFAEGPVLDGGGLLDLEVFVAASRRRFDAGLSAMGIDENGDEYEGRLDADGEAEGRYGRVEAGLAWELTDELGAETRVRFRHDREESDLDLREEIEIPPGDPPVVTLSGERARSTHRTVDVEAMLQSSPGEAFDLDVGYGARFENLNVDDAYDDTVDRDPVVHGLLAEARARPSEDLSLRGRLRAFTTDDPYTRLSAERRALIGVDADWRTGEFVTLAAGISRSRAALEAGGSHSDLDTAHATVILQDPGGALEGRFGVTGQDYELEVATTAQVSGFPTAYDARFAGRSYLWNGFLTWRASKDTRWWGSFDLANVLDDNSSNLYTARLGVEHLLSPHLTLRTEVAAWRFDGSGAQGDDDFQTNVFEVSVEYGL